MYVVLKVLVSFFRNKNLTSTLKAGNATNQLKNDDLNGVVSNADC
jgi:hypothetical protein